MVSSLVPLGMLAMMIWLVLKPQNHRKNDIQTLTEELIERKENDFEDVGAGFIDKIIYNLIFIKIECILVRTEHVMLYFSGESVRKYINVLYIIRKKYKISKKKPKRH